MQLWQKFRALDPSDRWLTTEAAVLMAVTQIGFRVVSYAMLRRALDTLKRFRGSPQSQSRIGWAVNAVGRRLAGRTCLSEALAADVMLCRRGYSPSVRLGVRKTRGRLNAPEAHAWVECGGIVVTGQLAILDDYKLLR
jgi:hypothetical protein